MSCEPQGLKAHRRDSKAPPLNAPPGLQGLLWATRLKMRDDAFWGGLSCHPKASPVISVCHKAALPFAARPKKLAFLFVLTRF